MQRYKKILDELKEVDKQTSHKSGNYKATFTEDSVSIRYVSDDGTIMWPPTGMPRNYVSIPIEDARELASFILHMTEEEWMG